MKLEDQICTLEQAIKLKEPGVKQEGLFVWATGDHPIVREANWYISHPEIDHGRLVSAFTVSELLTLIPSDCEFFIRDNVHEWTAKSITKWAKGKTLIEALYNYLVQSLEAKHGTIN